MKRVLALCAIVSVLLVASALPAAGTHATFYATGRILVPNPTTGVFFGVSDLAASCDPASPFNGVDGVWYAIGGFDVHTAVLTPGEATTNVDAYFYSANCDRIPTSYSMARQPLGQTETGTVPVGAAFIIVDMSVGAAGTFTLSIS